MKGAVEALGYNPDRLHVIIMQLNASYRQEKSPGCPNEQDVQLPYLI